MNSMEKKDKIIVIINGEEKNIYPLMELEKDKIKYIVYTTVSDLKEIEGNIYIGILNGDKILPIDNDELEFFDKVVQDIIRKIH